MKIKTVLVSLIILTGFIIMACGGEKLHDSRPVLTVSILPQKYFVEKIAGDIYQVNVLIPPGASPATYEPSPKQIADFHRSAAYLTIGEIGFEKIWKSKLTASNPDIPLFNLSENINFIQQNIRHGDHSHIGRDPHIWISPKNGVRIAQNLFNALVSLSPEKEQYFEENLIMLEKEVLSIDSLYQEAASHLKGLNFLIYHPVLGYLARDYGMVQHSLEYEGKEPPPSHIARLIETAKENDIRKIFIQNQFSTQNAKSLAEEIQAEIIEIDPLNENWSQEMKSILHHLLEQ